MGKALLKNFFWPGISSDIKCLNMKSIEDYYSGSVEQTFNSLKRENDGTEKRWF